MDRLTVRRSDGRFAIANNDGATPREQTMKIPMVLSRLAAYEDTGLEPETVKEVRDIVLRTGSMDHLLELCKADREGRVVVLPFQQHKTLFDMSDPQHPELLKNFRISATWTHCGIVFNSPWGIFLQQIEQGYIKQVSEEAEAALKGESHETNAV